MKHGGCILLLFICLIFSFAAAGAEGVMYLPEALTIIEAEAFCNCSAINQVVLGDRVTHIGSRAFSGSALTEINLPDSIVSIADDAFDGCSEGLVITAKEGTYAYEWAANKGFFDNIELSEIVLDLPIRGLRIDIIKGTFQIPYHLEPTGARAELVWKSLHPEIATVDQNGLVTLLKTGRGSVSVCDIEGRHRADVHFEVVGELHTSDGLKYELLEDQSGYRVADIEGDPQRITIPASWQGLPVKGFKPGAFKNCTQLTDIALEPVHTVLYMENSALYANLPAKTLLCYPGKHAPRTHYYITSGTKAIAPYAFSHCYLDYIEVPDSLVSIGDCAFYSLPFQMGVYMTDSVTEFGASLFQNQQGNGYFYVPSWESPGAIYANKYNIPVGVIVNRTPEPTMVPTPTPAPTSTPDIPDVDMDKIAVYDTLDNVYLEKGIKLRCTYDISSLEGDAVSEVRLAIQDQWQDMSYYGFARQTGLYGAGRTNQKALLRGYDRKGRLVGAKEISGDFVFAFDGAYMLGVSGGSGTRMTVVPTRPIFVSKPGRYPIQPNEWHKTPDGNIYQHFVLQMPRSTLQLVFPQHVNMVGCTLSNALTDQYTHVSQAYGAGYTICTAETLDSSRLDQVNQVTMVFDYMEKLLSNDHFSCYIFSQANRSENLGEDIYDVYQSVRTQMLKGHYPSDLAIKPVQVRLNGNYPGAYLSIVELDDRFFIFDDDDVCTAAHELIHAIDQGLQGDRLLPKPWLEGRAEYISLKVCTAMGTRYTSDDYGAGKDYNWAFLSETDRADFCSFYCSRTNRINTYPVGYYFYQFLIDTYGSNVGAAVMRNIAKANFSAGDRCTAFRKCVEAATEEGVFQRFITDVVIPSGT